MREEQAEAKPADVRERLDSKQLAALALEGIKLQREFEARTAPMKTITAMATRPPGRQRVVCVDFRQKVSGENMRLPVSYDRACAGCDRQVTTIRVGEMHVCGPCLEEVAGCLTASWPALRVAAR